MSLTLSPAVLALETFESPRCSPISLRSPETSPKASSDKSTAEKTSEVALTITEQPKETLPIASNSSRYKTALLATAGVIVSALAALAIVYFQGPNTPEPAFGLNNATCPANHTYANSTLAHTPLSKFSLTENSIPLLTALAAPISQLALPLHSPYQLNNEICLPFDAICLPSDAPSSALVITPKQELLHKVAKSTSFCVEKIVMIGRVNDPSPPVPRKSYIKYSRYQELRYDGADQYISEAQNILKEFLQKSPAVDFLFQYLNDNSIGKHFTKIKSTNIAAASKEECPMMISPSELANLEDSSVINDLEGWLR